VTELKDLAKSPANLANWPELPALVEIGLFAAHTGQVAKAKALFEGLAQAGPELLPVKLGLAFVSLVTNDFEKAEAGLKEVLAKSPDHAEAKALLGLCLAISGRHAEAKPILEQVGALSGPAAELAKLLTSGL
jgi:thioredoxin-like negative regulator of GroEL